MTSDGGADCTHSQRSCAHVRFSSGFGVRRPQRSEPWRPAVEAGHQGIVTFDRQRPAAAFQVVCAARAGECVFCAVSPFSVSANITPSGSVNKVAVL
jgi:hypothetical protein